MVARRTMVNDVSRWPRFTTGTFGRYAIAVVATSISLLGRWLLDPFLGNFTPFLTLYAAVALAAIYAGFGPAILASVLGLVGADYWFVPPRESFLLYSMPHMVGTLTYLGVCTLIATAGEASRRSKAKLNRAVEQLQHKEEELQSAHDELQKRVRSRTADLERAEAKFRGLRATPQAAM